VGRWSLGQLPITFHQCVRRYIAWLNDIYFGTKAEINIGTYRACNPADRQHNSHSIDPERAATMTQRDAPRRGTVGDISYLGMPIHLVQASRPSSTAVGYLPSVPAY